MFRFGDRKTRMNWVHVHNLVQAHVLAAEALTAAKGYVAVSPRGAPTSPPAPSLGIPGSHTACLPQPKRAVGEVCQPGEAEQD